MRLSPLTGMRSQGFTLIELLTVVILIGVILTFASLSVGQHGDQTVKLEAQRLQHLLNLASEEAVIQARSMAVVFSRHGYQFAKIDGDKVLPIEEDSIFRKRELPEEIELELEYQGEPATFEDKDNPPRVYIFSSGEMTQFTLKFKMLDADPYTIEANFLGQVDLLPPGRDEWGS